MVVVSLKSQCVKAVGGSRVPRRAQPLSFSSQRSVGTKTEERQRQTEEGGDDARHRRPYDQCI